MSVLLKVTSRQNWRWRSSQPLSSRFSTKARFQHSLHAVLGCSWPSSLLSPRCGLPIVTLASTSLSSTTFFLPHLCKLLVFCHLQDLLGLKSLAGKPYKVFAVISQALHVGMGGPQIELTLTLLASSSSACSQQPTVSVRIAWDGL